MKAALEHKPQFTMDDGCDLVTMLLTKRHGSGLQRNCRHRRNHHRRDSPARHGQGRHAEVSDHRGERRDDQAFLRQSLRHRPVHAGRRDSRDQRADCGPESRHCRLRLVRTRRCHARQGPRRGRHHHGNRSGEGHRSRDGRLPRDADGRKPPKKATFSSPSPATKT